MTTDRPEEAPAGFVYVEACGCQRFQAGKSCDCPLTLKSISEAERGLRDFFESEPCPALEGVLDRMLDPFRTNPRYSSPRR